MIANGVGSWVNLLLPILVGLLLLGAVLGGAFLSPAQRKTAETYFLRPLGLLLLIAGLYWAGHETLRDLAKHDGMLVALHLGLAAVLIWFAVGLIRKLIASFKPDAAASAPSADRREKP